MWLKLFKRTLYNPPFTVVYHSITQESESESLTFQCTGMSLNDLSSTGRHSQSAYWLYCVYRTFSTHVCWTSLEMLKNLRKPNFSLKKLRTVGTKYENQISLLRNSEQVGTKYENQISLLRNSEQVGTKYENQISLLRNSKQVGTTNINHYFK